jgi:hypothetical protein
MTPPAWAVAEAQTVLGTCVCVPAYKDRELADPMCAWCRDGESVAILLSETRRKALEEAAQACDELGHDLLRQEADFLPRGNKDLLRIAFGVSTCSQKIRALMEEEK